MAFLGASEGINGVIFILRFYKYETIKKYGVYNFPEWGNHIISLSEFREIHGEISTRFDREWSDSHYSN